MNLLPSQVGAEPKKVGILIGLLVLGGVAYYVNMSDDGPPQGTASAPIAANPAAPRPLPTAPSAVGARGADSLTPMPPQRAQRQGDASFQDFKPTLKLPEGTDVSRIDPTLHLDLIAKLRESELEGGSRSLFDFGAAPKPKTPPVPEVAPVKPAEPKPAADDKKDTPPTTPVKPAAPPIPLKFYGYVNGARGGSRQALFLEGDDIYIAGENETVHNRYKVIRIGVNSAVVEDTTTKNQQTIPLVEELQG